MYKYRFTTRPGPVQVPTFVSAPRQQEQQKCKGMWLSELSTQGIQNINEALEQMSDRGPDLPIDPAPSRYQHKLAPQGNKNNTGKRRKWTPTTTAVGTPLD